MTATEKTNSLSAAYKLYSEMANDAASSIAYIINDEYHRKLINSPVLNELLDTWRDAWEKRNKASDEMYNEALLLQRKNDNE